jgi:hypothetical protein
MEYIDLKQRIASTGSRRIADGLLTNAETTNLVPTSRAGLDGSEVLETNLDPAGSYTR